MVIYKTTTPPSTLPESLPDGTVTSIAEDPYRLVGSARLVFEDDYEGGPKHARYRGDWRCETRKPSSFVAAKLVDWHAWRAAALVTEGIRDGELEKSPRPPAPRPIAKTGKGDW